jgi:MFS family permease
MRSASTFTLGSLIVLFFLWGLLTSLNDILVPHLKAAFDLQHWQAQLIQFFFFGAYFVMSIPAGVIIRKIGYKGGIVLGLILMGVGCAVFYPASIVKIYGVFLLGLFILASGITILQVAANPYVAVIGPPETAASRLNLAQGFNSLGHTIAPLFGAWLILQNTEIVEVESVQMPYLFLAGALVLIGLVFLRLQLPPIAYEEPDRRGFQLKNYPHLYLGAIAIFCYVGAEIAVGSFLVEYFKAEPTIGLDNKTAGSYVAFYWGGAMVGRFLGAIALGQGANGPPTRLEDVAGACAGGFDRRCAGRQSGLTHDRLVWGRSSFIAELPGVLAGKSHASAYVDLIRFHQHDLVVCNHVGLRISSTVVGAGHRVIQLHHVVEYLYPVDQRPEAIHQLRLFLAGDDDRWWGDHSDRTGPIG